MMNDLKTTFSHKVFAISVVTDLHKRLGRAFLAKIYSSLSHQQTLCGLMARTYITIMVNNLVYSTTSIIRTSCDKANTFEYLRVWIFLVAYKHAHVRKAQGDLF